MNLAKTIDHTLLKPEARAGDIEKLCKEAVEHGFFCVAAFGRDPWLDPLRANPQFVQILRHAEGRHREARTAFLEARGDRILGITT